MRRAWPWCTVLGMLGPDDASLHLEALPVQPLGLIKMTLRLEDHSKVCKCHQGVGVLRTPDLAPSRGIAEQPFRLSVFSLPLQYDAQVVHCSERFSVFGALREPSIVEPPPEDLLGIAEPTLFQRQGRQRSGRVQTQIVEAAEKAALAAADSASKGSASVSRPR